MSAVKNSRGLWQALLPLEVTSSVEIAKSLEAYVKPVTDCYECGVEVPTLPCKCQGTNDIAIAALFLKRLLNDLRATWNLVLLGYTSQAGSVAAAAFENALIICCIAGHIDRAEEMIRHQGGGSPWSVSELCRMYESDSYAIEGKDEKSTTNDNIDDYWRVNYSLYSWLCKVKHPTLPSALHDAFSVTLDNRQYIVMAAPDTRAEDLPNKAFIIDVTTLKFVEAIRRFARARYLDYDKPNVVSWQERFDSIAKNLDVATDPIMTMPLPFTYDGRRLVKPKQTEYITDTEVS